jgi:hypothetical protein
VTVSSRIAWTLAAAAAVALCAPVVLTVTLDQQRGRTSAPVASSVALASPSPPPSPSSSTALPSPSPSPSPSASPSLDAENLAAGILGNRFSRNGSGTLVVVPGRVAAPGHGTVHRVRVEIERGLPVDPRRFARFVMTTLNDPRGWGARGRLTFARTDGAADIRVILATPGTNAALCRPLDTKGDASCGREGRAVLTMSRWIDTTPEFARIRTTYRQYVVNHEVGHLLGHPHQMCPRKGALAPIMQQQTYGLNGCRPNPWPYP